MRMRMATMMMPQQHQVAAASALMQQQQQQLLSPRIHHPYAAAAAAATSELNHHSSSSMGMYQVQPQDSSSLLLFPYGASAHDMLYYGQQAHDQISPQVAQYLRLQALARLQEQQQQQHGSFPQGEGFFPGAAIGAARFPQQQRMIDSADAARFEVAAAAPTGVSYGARVGGPAVENLRGMYGGIDGLDTHPQRQQHRTILGGSMGLRGSAGAPTHFPFPVATSSNPLSGVGIGSQGAVPIHGGIPLRLPVILAQPEDSLKLSSHQVLLRHQIEAFQASEDDIGTHTRGRNKPIVLGQVGIRCRHCAHLPVACRQKGSTYFPATLLGLYQAAQNMSTTHMQCGLCSAMPDSIKMQFAHLLSTKVSSSGAGRPYWASSAKKLGLVNTEDGIHFIRDLPANARVLEDGMTDERGSGGSGSKKS
jgi:hypothetical protein